MVLGLFVIYKNRSSRANQIWCLATIFCSIWSLFYLLTIRATDFKQALFFAKVSQVSASYMMALVVHFCSEITESNPSRNIFIKIGYLLSLVFTLASFTDSFLSVRPFLNFNYYFWPRLFYYFFTAYILFSFCYSEYILIKSLKKSEIKKRNQILYIIVGLFLGYFGGFVGFFPVYGIPIEPYAMHFVWLYAAVISYAIVKHRLMDIKVVFQKTLFYSFFVFLLSIFYVSIVFIIHGIFETGFSFNVSNLNQSRDLSLYAVPPLVGTVVFLFLGFFTLFNRPKTQEKTLFSILCFETFFWQFIWFYSFYCPKEDLTYIAKIAYLTITPLPFTFYHFIVSYLKQGKERKYVILFYGIAFILILLIFPTDLFVSGNRQLAWGNFTLPGPLYFVFALSALMSMARGVFIIRRAYQESLHVPERRNQLKYFFLGFGLYFFCTLDFFQVYGATWYPIGSLFFLLSFIVIAYAILKHHLMDVQVIIKKTIYYSILTISISLVYLALVFLFYLTFLAGKKTSSLWVNFSSILFIAVTFKPLEIWFHRILERRFFKGTIGEISEQKERLETELERRERLKSVGILAAGMAHEIKNPLTAINTFAEYLPTKYDDPEFREKFTRIVRQEVSRVKDIITNLLLFSKPSDPCPVRCDIPKILLGILELLSSECLKAGVRVAPRFDGHEAFVDPEQMKQAFLNIILNAIEAMREKGDGELKVLTRLGGGGLQVVIEDTGCGISPDKAQRIFDPFYTDKPQGTGLGLAVTHSIIEKNRGKISVESKVGQGTKFTITIPLE